MRFGTPDKWQLSKDLAATLADLSLCRYDRVVLAGLRDGRAQVSRTFSGRRSFPEAEAWLDALETGGAWNLAANVTRIMEEDRAARLAAGARDLDRTALATRTPVGMRAFVIGGMLVALLFAAVVSQFAVDDPDGLERVAEDTGFIESAEDHALAASPFAASAVAPTPRVRQRA